MGDYVFLYLWHIADCFHQTCSVTDDLSGDMLAQSWSNLVKFSNFSSYILFSPSHVHNLEDS